METKHLNPFQLSRRWGIAPKTLQNWRSQGKGPAFIKVGGHVLYRMEDIERYEHERLQIKTAKTKLVCGNC
jgi:predicted site-specific integrase-resolvase